MIPDGNRRYARSRNVPVTAGHRAGAETAEQLLEWCVELAVPELTVYGFSTENFHRDPDERSAILGLIAEKLEELAESDRVHRHEVRIAVFGDRDRLPIDVRRAATRAEAATAGYAAHRCNVALAYGGRTALLDGVQRTLHAVADGRIDPSAIDVTRLEERLGAVPDRPVDLLVRTGGEQRTSNFLPWRARGATMVTSPRRWPAFDRAALLEAFRIHERMRAETVDRDRAREHAIERLTASDPDGSRASAATAPPRPVSIHGAGRTGRPSAPSDP